MNLSALSDTTKGVSAKNIFKTENSNVTAIQIPEGQTLKEHITKVPALLVCVFGEVVFENEKGETEKLNPGDFLEITPLVKHWVKANKNSQLILVR